MFSSNTSQVSNDANYIEDVFSTYLYTGNGTTGQTINNGIDLTEGGLVVFKNRAAASWDWIDTNRGGNNSLRSNFTSAEYVGSSTEGVTAFNSNGFTLGANIYSCNGTSQSIVSWTFRKQPKFFDVVTYTGNAANRTIAHSLGSVPGSIWIKRTDSTSNWTVYHKDLGVDQGYTGKDFAIWLNLTNAQDGIVDYWNNTSPTSTVFSIGANATVNSNGGTYVAYLFAHNAGGFGLTGTDNVISCGSFTTDGSGNATVNLGYEPQWLLTKNVGGGNWRVIDVMRGMSQTGAELLYANTSDSATAVTGSNLTPPTATGFLSVGNNTSSDYIYIAIRRGPMKVPTDATKVFIPVSATPSGSTTVTTNFPVDLAINAQRDAGTSGNKVFWDRLRGSSTAAGQGLFSTLTNAEVSYSGNGIGLQSNTTIVDNYWNTLNGATTPVIYWNMRRAPSFFDEVCYTGNGTAGRTITHNLTVTPELIITKERSAGSYWYVYSAATGPTQYLRLESTNAPFTYSGVWNNTAPTSSVFTVGSDGYINASGQTYVAYLFATCAGVSKVGSYTGTGTTLQIDCGFTAGSRFVLIKRTDSTGSWYVWDVARGISSGNDPYLLLNSTAAEVTNTDYIDAYSAGFEISSTAPAEINASGGTFIYLSIA